MKKKFISLMIILAVVFTFAQPVIKNDTQNVQTATLKQKAKKAYSKIVKRELKNSSYVSYFYKDISGDGIDELFCGTACMIDKIYSYKSGKMTSFKSDYLYGEVLSGGTYYLKKNKEVILYNGGTTDSYSSYKIKNGKLVIKKAASILKKWNNSGSFTLQYYLKGKKVSERKYNEYFEKLENVDVK